MCRSRPVSGNEMASGAVMSSPCAQCSASRVVASVRGFNPFSARRHELLRVGVLQGGQGGASGGTPALEDGRRVGSLGLHQRVHALVQSVAPAERVRRGWYDAPGPSQ
jgi:hypothetical protein